MPKRTKSSAAWIAEHESDPFVKRAREEGWRSRAVFKLEEIQKQDRLLKPGMTIVDLGAAPGGWSQYAVRHLAGKGRIIAMDILDMPTLPGSSSCRAISTTMRCWTGCSNWSGRRRSIL